MLQPPLNDGKSSMQCVYMCILLLNITYLQIIAQTKQKQEKTHIPYS